MQSPFFYIGSALNDESILTLSEENSRHIAQVLRMTVGEKINLTDGRGALLTATIINDHKKHCQVQVSERRSVERPVPSITIAISLLKNATRFEWFLEKATETGVSKIILLNCERTEKQKYRMDRFQGICIAAMLQSEQCWLPEITELVKIEKAESWKQKDGLNLVAHCADMEKQPLQQLQIESHLARLIAIGPEGDFTPGEIQLLKEEGFVPVSLGETRLRTETAGLVAATLLKYK
jgi:16S rRNA (uracil1498-N3)-methyltransferase